MTLSINDTQPKRHYINGNRYVILGAYCSMQSVIVLIAVMPSVTEPDKVVTFIFVFVIPALLMDFSEYFCINNKC